MRCPSCSAVFHTFCTILCFCVPFFHDAFLIISGTSHICFLSPSYARPFVQIEHKDLASTLEKLKAQHPSLYIPAAQSDGLDDDNNTVSDDIKPFSEMTAATPMDISRLVSHLSNAVATARGEVSTLLHELQPLKEKVITLKDDCDEKKKVVLLRMDRISLGLTCRCISFVNYWKF